MQSIRLCSAVALVIVCGTAQAAPVQLLTNGGFETGSYAGWTTAVQAGSSGNLFIDTPGTTTPSGNQATAANPAGGAFYSVSAQTGPGAYSLRQNFTVAPGATSVILSFQMFVNSYGGGPIFGNGLDYTGPANQHARVDILTAAAGAFDLGTFVLQNLYLGIDPVGTNPNPYTNYSFDLTSLVGGGGTFQIRFAQVDNQGFFNQGVDNVSILATTGANAVPEPTTLGLVGLALAGLALSRRRRG